MSHRPKNCHSGKLLEGLSTCQSVLPIESQKTLLQIGYIDLKGALSCLLCIVTDPHLSGTFRTKHVSQFIIFNENKMIIVKYQHITTYSLAPCFFDIFEDWNKHKATTEREREKEREKEPVSLTFNCRSWLCLFGISSRHPQVFPIPVVFQIPDFPKELLGDFGHFLARFDASLLDNLSVTERQTLLITQAEARKLRLTWGLAWSFMVFPYFKDLGNYPTYNFLIFSP